ncbi:MAG: S-layer protein [uncultured bacterium (gcode 4)]|uniref:S-layer protein n=1 Tax=uncultured bacterium (gcode 4) TaxID=1234023 RepID=K2G214_9BACT|nr:MAG: S-layer protein [uncultured bacterium (gcode 4)]
MLTQRPNWKIGWMSVLFWANNLLNRKLRFPVFLFFDINGNIGHEKQKHLKTSLNLIQWANSWNSKYLSLNSFYMRAIRINIKPTMAIIMAFLITIVPAMAASWDFTDISTSFAKEDIVDFANRWFIRWFDDGTFRPENTTTRAEFLALSMKALGKPVDELLMTTWYADVPMEWMIKYVEKARQYGINWEIIDGKPVFRPDDAITRAEALAMLLNISWIKTPSQAISSFSDVKMAWMIRYVEKAKEIWLISGQNMNWNLIFRPDDSITRAEAVRIIKNTETYLISQRAQAQTSTVNILNFSFLPETITIRAWDTIRWKNSDPQAHQISFSDWRVQVTSWIIDVESQYAYTFRNAWTVDYTCAIHPNMKWKIIIK